MFGLVCQDCYRIGISVYIFGVSRMASEHPSMAMWSCRGEQVFLRLSENVEGGAGQTLRGLVESLGACVVAAGAASQLEQHRSWHSALNQPSRLEGEPQILFPAEMGRGAAGIETVIERMLCLYLHDEKSKSVGKLVGRTPNHSRLGRLCLQVAGAVPVLAGLGVAFSTCMMYDSCTGMRAVEKQPNPDRYCRLEVNNERSVALDMTLSSRSVRSCSAT